MKFGWPASRGDASRPAGLNHFDRGRAYAAADYRKDFSAALMIQSPRRKRNDGDNAALESCFGTRKTELVDQACHATRDAGRHRLFACIEGCSNRQRLAYALGYITPEQATRQAASSGVPKIAGGTSHAICAANRRKEIVPCGMITRAPARPLSHALCPTV
ncbi:MAG: hypothetical protein ACREC9_10245 [Methylocella sp.]